MTRTAKDNDEKSKSDFAPANQEPRRITGGQNTESLGSDLSYEQQTSETAIGRATATEYAPNSSEKFSFWLKPGNMINPFDIVAAKQGLDDSMTYGLVTNIHHSTD